MTKKYKDNLSKSSSESSENENESDGFVAEYEFVEEE